MYKQTDICAVIVTYNCDLTIDDNIDSLLKQVRHLLIIDNHSEEKGRERINSWQDHEQVTVIMHKKNEGLAVSLNEALKFAWENHDKLLLTMDQDAILNRNCVANMLNELNKCDNVAAVGPNRNVKVENTREKSYLIVSGCLIVVEKALQAGGYCEDLFVDNVDFDFSLALRSKGYKLLMVGDARMQHKVGVYEENVILGKKIRYLTHSPERFYDMYRGQIIVIKRYFLKFPLFCVKWMLIAVKEIVLMQFESNVKEKNKNVRKGIKSGLSYKVTKEDTL